MTVQQRNSQMVELLRADLQGRYEPQFALAQYVASVLALPGLRGFWPMSAYDASGNAFDLGGNSRTLTYNGNPTYNYAGLAPYINFDGTGDYLSRTDEAGLDILGTESYVANPGLTVGGWFYNDAAGSSEFLTSKYTTTGNQRSWAVEKRTDEKLRLYTSGDGTALVSVVSDDIISTPVWFWMAARFEPSTQLSIFVNDGETTNTTSVPASLFNSTAPFLISGFNAGGSGLITGRASLCWLCAAELSNAIILNLFRQSRAIFGV